MEQKAPDLENNIIELNEENEEQKKSQSPLKPPLDIYVT